MNGMLRLAWAVVSILPAGLTVGLIAADRPTDPSHPPRSVRRYDAAYRYTQAGWVVLHIEGEPYTRGYQHGRLMADEIARYLATLARERYPDDPAEGWRTVRLLADALFLRRMDREVLEEMKGIATGAADAGARFDGRPPDLVDIVGLNIWQELQTLEPALAVTPTGLEGAKRTTPVPPKPDHCSAFVAAGPATADGRIVFGHITMFGLYLGPFVNVWIDCRPARGHRFVMQGFPGAVWSSQDFYLNEAGILLCETTIDQTPFDPTGEPLTSRARRAIQYARSIDDVVTILTTRNNGLYANEWLIADTKTNEIAMLELGTRHSRLWRGSKGEWFGNTPGFYWGCNNAKDRAVRREARSADAPETEPDDWQPTDRDLAWIRFYRDHKGRIDAEAARKVLASPELALPHSLDAKVTTTALARELSAWALYGPPTGRTWKPTRQDRLRHPDIPPLEPHPWTLLTVRPPPEPPARSDLPDFLRPRKELQPLRP